MQAALDCLIAAAWEGALHHLDVVLRQEPGNAMLHFLRAQAWTHLGEPARALAELDRAVTLEPRCRRLWVDRCRLRLRQRDYAGAAADFVKALRITTDDFTSWPGVPNSE